MKSKFTFGLLAMMLVLALAPSSFAQVNIQIFGAASAGEVATVKNAQTADPLSSGAGLTVSGSVIANIELTTTRLDINFGGPITSNCSPASGSGSAAPVGVGCVGGVPVPTGDPIQIAGASGLFAGAYISTISFATGVIQIALPECKAAAPGVNSCASPVPAGPMASGSFRIVGVRIDVNGKTAPIQATATLVNTANGYINTSTPQTLITALGAGLIPLALGTAGTATAFTNGAVTDTTASVALTEGFPSAWRSNTFPGLLTGTSSTAGGAAPVNSHQIRLTVSGIPTGMTLTATTSPTTYGIAASGSTTASTRAWLITVPATTNLSTTETVTTTFTLGAGTATIPIAPGAISMTATMFPVGNPTIVGTGVAADGFPVFTATEVGPITIANVVPASTTLLMPFAVRDGAYDTGISLANTTADPFGGAGSGGATASAGTVTLAFFPRLATGGAGTSFTLTTSATARPGIGLSSDGSLAAGATWTALLSELLTAAGQTGGFTGYIFITTNFTNAHGAPFVSDFRNFTSYTPMLVLPPPVTLAGGRSAVPGGENLNN